MNLNLIKLDHLAENIFSDVAQEAANFLHQQKESNKSTQLRKFYNELLMWHDKVHHTRDRDEAYHQAAPFIQMLKAKAAYAQERGYVDKNFVDVFNKIIGQINSPETLKHAKLFFEAILGFRKAYEQK